jgi:hypothetical protein
MNLTSEQIIAQLKEHVPYDKFNTTTIIFVLYSCIGINGAEAKQVALDLLAEFIDYVNTRPAYYIPDSSVEPMLHSNVLANLHSWCKDFTNTNLLSNRELMEFLGRKIYEFQKIQANRDLAIGGIFSSAIVMVLGILYYKYKK